jgi:hypothetical protein
MASDPLNLRGREFVTAGRAMGGIESRAADTASSDGALLAEVLAEAGLGASDDLIYQAGRFLGFSVARTTSAAMAALRRGLIST